MNRSQLLRLVPLGFAASLLASCLTNNMAPAPAPATDPAASSTNSTASASSPNQARGIDVSDNVGPINWSQVVAAGYTFAFVKATDGVSYSRVDYFYDNWPKMKSAGIIRGAYHFYESDDDPVAQADYFAEVPEKAGGLGSNDLPPVLDFERATSGANVLKFLKKLESETGRTPIIYVDESFANSYLSDPAFASYPLWIAEYGTQNPKVPATWANAGKSWSFWQTGQSGTVSGIPGGDSQTDLDRFHGDVNALKSFIREN